MTVIDSDVRRHVRWAEAALAIALTTGSLTTPPPHSTTSTSSPSSVVISRVGSSVGENFQTSRPIETKPLDSSPWTVSALRDLSGLTATQIGRLFGVSRRSINNWMAGSPMAAHHETRLSVLRSVFLAIPASSPDERRSALLDSSSGPTLFQQLVSEVSEGPVLQSNPLAARNQF